MRSRKLAIMIVLCAAAGAVGQQQNSNFAAMALGEPASNRVGEGPILGEIYTDSITDLEIFGLAFEPYILIAGDYIPGWIVVQNLFSIDIAFASTSKIICDGFAPGEVRFHTGADGRATLSYVYDGSVFDTDSSVAVQGLIADPTNPFGVSLTAAVVADIRSGYRALFFTDDDGAFVPLLHNMEFSFFGQAPMDQIFVASNGWIGFENANTDAAATFSEFRGGPARIAPFFCDLDPNGCTIEVRQFLADGLWNVNVRWIDVPEALSRVPHSFDVTLKSDNSIVFHWDGSNEAPSVNTYVGISPGYNTDTAMTALDLSNILGNFYETSYGSAAFEVFDHGSASPIHVFDLSDVTLTFYPSVAYTQPFAYYIY